MGTTAAGDRSTWIRDRSLTLVMLGGFAIFLAGQVLTGWADYNDGLHTHGLAPAALSSYLGSGHFWEALFENWESEFLQMAAFVGLTTRLHQVGSPESRRPGVLELVDADPRHFAHLPGVPWPVRRGGIALWLYERSLSLAFIALFLASWVGHAYGGWAAEIDEARLHGISPSSLADYVVSSRFWFESFQNWQSEFLSVAAMVWLAVYLRQRGSPESKAVHAAHDETGR
jgi:hypothetical protein